MNEQNKKKRACEGDLIVNGTDEGMDVKDCIIGVLVTFGILVMYAVAGMMEAV